MTDLPKARRKRSDSIEAKVQAFQGAIKDIEPPEYIQITDEEELAVWRQFTRARAREDWRDMDLILLAKVVKTEVKIRRHEELLVSEGEIMENQRGTPIVNPRAQLIDTLTRQQLSVIRSMSLNQTASDARTVNAKAKTASEKDGPRDTISFLALPVKKDD